MKTLRVFLLLLLLVTILGNPITVARAGDPASLRVFFIDVGQGDATLIRAGEDFEALVDGGRKSAGESVLELLRRLVVDDLEVVVATHADSDHIGGLIDVLQADDIPVESALYNGYPGDTQTWAQFVAAVAAEGLSLAAAQYPQTLTWGELSAAVLNPTPGLGDPEQNEASVVLRLELDQISLILPADIESGVEAHLLTRGDLLDAEILKVAHHGSQSSTSPEFLAAVQPSQAVISVGDNAYGHPAPQTLARLAAVGAKVWRTDYSGTIVLLSDGVGYQLFPLDTFVPLAVHR